MGWPARGVALSEPEGFESLPGLEVRAAVNGTPVAVGNLRLFRAKAAPALPQADVGVAMEAAGTDVAIEAAHIALMREDWTLVPEARRIARRTMRIVNGNIGFPAVYTVLGLTLAAFGFPPPVLAAAAQRLPDLEILGNSSRLLKQD